MKLNFLSTALASVLLSASVVGAASAEGDYILNTASTGGTYHPVGTAIATCRVCLAPTQPLAQGPFLSRKPTCVQ